MLGDRESHLSLQGVLAIYKVKLKIPADGGCKTAQDS